MNDKIISWLKNNKWTIEEYVQKISFDELRTVLSRYEFLDDDYFDFIARVRSCVNEDETIWFNCFSEFSSSSDIAFKWNEFELMSLEAAENDDEWQKSIKIFWNNNVPIIMSVVSGYSYYAIRRDGKVVFGVEPEFEEVKVVADSFRQFLEKIMKKQIVF